MSAASQKNEKHQINVNAINKGTCSWSWVQFPALQKWNKIKNNKTKPRCASTEEAVTTNTNGFILPQQPCICAAW